MVHRGNVGSSAGLSSADILALGWLYLGSSWNNVFKTFLREGIVFESVEADAIGKTCFRKGEQRVFLWSSRKRESFPYLP